MKKYSFILCIALVAFVVASCGLKGNHTSSGRAPTSVTWRTPTRKATSGLAWRWICSTTG